MKYLKPILLILLFAGCEEYFVPNIDSVRPVYAFDGYVTNLPGPYCIKVMKSKGYNAEQPIEYITDASVTIECDDGQIYPLTHKAYGNYYTDSASFLGVINKSYRLKVVTADGKEFESGYEQMLECPEIEELTAQYYETKKITLDGTTYRDEVEKGLQVMNTTNAAAYTPYYRYECRLILQSQQHYSVEPAPSIERYIFRPYNSQGNLYIANAKDYENKHITGNQLYSTSTKMFRHADDNIIQGLDYEVRNCGEYVKVTQYSMTEAQYNYWEAISHQLESKNYLFGELEHQVVGNIKCTTDEGEQALGFFGASAAKSKIRAFGLHEYNNTVRTYDIDTFPDTDTVMIFEGVPKFAVTFSN